MPHGISPEPLFGGQPVLDFKSGVSRRSFLRGAAVVGVGSSLALGGLTSLASPAGAATMGSGGSDDASDIDILNYALTLEYLESDFYDRGLAAGILSGRDLELVAPIAVHEAAHVEALLATLQSLGETPVSKPNFQYPDGTFGDRDTFLGTAQRFEEFGVSAYHGQVAKVDNYDILAAAASIAGVESRHAAILSQLTGRRPFPGPFEYPAPMSVILQAAGGFIAGGA